MGLGCDFLSMAQPTLGSLITRLEELVVRYEVALKRLENFETIPSKEERAAQSLELDQFIKEWRRGRIDDYLSDE